jgi:hypothetical protein
MTTSASGSFVDDLVNTDSGIWPARLAQQLTQWTLKNAGSPTVTTDNKSYMGLELTGLSAKLIGIRG